MTLVAALIIVLLGFGLGWAFYEDIERWRGR
jgi:hypothetical protein